MSDEELSAVAKDGNGTGLVYRVDEKTWSVYDMWFEDRVIFEVAVNNTDPELKIYVGRLAATWAMVHDLDDDEMSFGDLIETKGRAKRGTHEVGGTPVSPGEIKDHIDGATIQSYVYPRLLFLMAAVYVPLKPQVPPVSPTQEPQIVDKSEDVDPLGDTQL